MEARIQPLPLNLDEFRRLSPALIRRVDPAAVATWVGELPPDSVVVVFCAHGHEVSRATAVRLRAAGHARYLRGGIDGWQGAGRPPQAKGAAS